MPETVGKIIWAKSLFDKISTPIFKLEKGIVNKTKF